jgi:pilus assembly protein CpaE
MGISWFYFSDTNTDPAEIKACLENKQYSLFTTNQIASLHKQLIENETSVLFLKANSVFNIYDLCQEISVLYPHVYIILIVPDNMENIKKAMHMGASDILRTSYTTEELNESILQAKKYMEHRLGKDSRPSRLLKEKTRVLAVCSPKGGVGKTSFTANLAIAFAKEGKQVGVIDANIQFGDIPMYFNEKPKKTIYEWVKEAYGRSTYTIDQYMIQHETGVSILAAPPRPEFFEGIFEEHMKTAIEEAKKLYDVVLIDMSSYISEIHMSCLDLTDEILLLTTNDLSTIRTSKLYLETLESINLKDKVKVILNKNVKGQGLDVKRVGEIIGLDIYSVLPCQEKVTTTAVATGLPFVLSNPRSPLSKAVIQVSEKLYDEKNVEEIPKRKKGKRRFLLST